MENFGLKSNHLKSPLIFPQFGAPGRLPIFKVFKGALTRARALTKTCHDLRLVIFRMLTLKSFNLILPCSHAFLVLLFY